MIPITLTELRDVVGGDLHGIEDVDPAALVIDGPVVTDSREAGPGSLYIARLGEHADGHDFIGPAAEGGAVAALVSIPTPGLPQVVVADVQAGFAALARHLIDSRPDLQVIGITGSSGKTSTKDLLGTVLGAAGPTVAPEGSYNSEVGVPLTVCRITPETTYLVVELGARGPGHIDYLTGITAPRIGIVLNVGHAHVGEFGSLEQVAAAKGELPAALPSDGVAILNADDPRVRSMAERTGARVVLVGEAEDAEIRATDIALDDRGRPHFTLSSPRGTAAIELPLVGRHHVGNALAVVAAALEAGLALEDVAGSLRTAGPISRWRMEVTRRPDGVTIVNDAYNANPDSMAAALRGVAEMAAAGRRVAVLGAMLELGEESAALHHQVGVQAVDHGFDWLVAVGDEAEAIADGAESAGIREVDRVLDADAAESLLRSRIADGDVVVFKSSRDAGLRWLGDRLSQREATS